jgi:PadR family transcriptional regulator PadR
VIQPVDRKFQKELNAGTAALVLLSIVAQAREPIYGYQIAKRLYAGASQAPIMKQGALYPVLRSLERTGLLRSEVEPSVAGPPRRYYRATDEGRAALGRWVRMWNEERAFVESLLKGSDHE